MKQGQRRPFASLLSGTIVLLLLLSVNGCRIFTPSGSSGVPEVQIVNPADGDTVSTSQEIIRVQVNSSEETKKVRFFDNNLFLGEDYDAPFEHVWEIAYVSIGQHELYAEVVDASGNIGRSEAVTVYVSKEGLFDWGMVASPTSNDLFSVFGIDAQAVWACGTNGTVLKFEGSGWIMESVPAGMEEDLLDIFFINSGRGWSVGSNTMLSYENGSWSTLLSFTKKELHSLYIFDEWTGWVGDGDGFVYRFDGDTIIEYDVLDTVPVTDILGITPSDVWASCGNSIFHYDGTFWGRDTTFPGKQINAIASFGTSIQAVGTGIFVYDGTSWKELELPVSVGAAYGLFLSSEESGIICGETQGRGFAFSFADTLWTEMSLQRDYPLYGLFGFVNGDGWAVGAQGTILRRNAQ
jgi:hypothetical protein